MRLKGIIKTPVEWLWFAPLPTQHRSREAWVTYCKQVNRDPAGLEPHYVERPAQPIATGITDFLESTG
jgi:hypothetical protein